VRKIQKFPDSRWRTDAILKIIFLAITRLHIVRLRRNFQFGGTIACARRLDDENVKFRKSNKADGRHFENRYNSISQPRIVQIWGNLVRRCKFWVRRRKRDKKIRNSQSQDGGRTPYWKSFLALTRLHIVRLRPKLEWGGVIARTRPLDDENIKFRKSNMANGRHFENRYSSISQPRIVQIWRNLVSRRKFWVRRRKRDKNSEIPKFKMADGRHIENHFWL